jgi:diguanylate cyclase (GGDEF)-like protein
VATVRSIVVPIRQFMLTTGRLAAGDDAARFARGGIKELDALAVSFNRMADSLADARAVTREYQEQLESRVDQRTRQLQHLAQHDPLTGLPNRRQLTAHLDRSLRRAARDGLRVAVFFLDLDNFKNINDSMGHAFGDLVLQGIAQRLREAAAASGFAARLGGDEFTVVHDNAGSHEQVIEAGNALLHAVQQPLFIEGRELVISMSVGASIYPDHEPGPDALLRAADAALFRAKTSGRARVSLFSPDLLQAAALKFSLEQGLRRALEHDELELWFQPEVSFATLDTQLVEALLRWRLPDGKYIAPADFLSVAEDSGLISSINDWVLRNAIRHAAGWHQGVWPNARVAINVSARQLLDAGFVARLAELLQENRLPAGCIEIELTETVLQTEAATIEVLHELRRLGVSIALDDFGTGYSSLASLERLPLTRVKLDRSLIDTIDSSARSLAIARAIVGLCESLDLKVTAEGVERHEQLVLLASSPMITLQGYLFARPVSADSVPEALSAVSSQLESLLVGGLPGVSAVVATAPDPGSPPGEIAVG